MIPTRRLAALAGCVILLATACTQAIPGTPVGAPVGTPGPGSASSGTTAAPSPTGPAPTPAPLQFTDCTKALLGAGLSVPAALTGKLAIGCGRLEVPLDYTRPAGPQLGIAVIRVHYLADTAPVGSLLVNPGGPGSSGLNFALEFLNEVPPPLLAKLDLIGFDPRGVGLSSPVRCLTDAQKDAYLASSADVTTPAGLAVAKAQSRQFSQACEQKYGSALAFYNTENTARDMDQIRQAVGDSRMNYLGFSYGTELGWVYAHLFPGRMRAIVLDGAVDPDTNPTTQFANQVQGFENAFDQFAANCRTVSPCRQLADPRQTVYQVAAAADKQPLHTSSGRVLTSSLAYTGVLQALYSRSLWPLLAQGLINAEHGDGTALLRLADSYNERAANGTYTNSLDAGTTISCNDSPPGPSDATVVATARRWVVRYPMFGRWSASGLIGCLGWQPLRTLVPKPSAATPTKVLVIGNLHDPATPYKGAQDLTADLGNAELLTWDGAGHTSYLEGSSCVDNYVNGYLLTQQLPPDHTVCPAK